MKRFLSLAVCTAAFLLCFVPVCAADEGLDAVRERTDVGQRVVAAPPELPQSSPVILADALSCTVSLHGTASFRVTASGERLRYQWQLFLPESQVWVPITEQYVDALAGADTACLSFRAQGYPDGAIKVRCVVSDVYGGSVTGGAASLTVRDRENRVIDAAYYGADGQDERDDREAIQAALDYARDHATGNQPVTVRLEDGVYRLDAPVFIYSHTRLTLSDGAELLYTGSGGRGLFAAPASLLIGGDQTKAPVAAMDPKEAPYRILEDVVIRGGRWNANAAAQNACTRPISLRSAADIRIEGVTVTGSSSHCIWLCCVKNVEITDCTFRSYVAMDDAVPRKTEAVFVESFPRYEASPLMSSQITVRGCLFQETAGGVGVSADDFFRHHSELTVENCVFRRVLCECVRAERVADLVVTACRAEDCGAFLWAAGTSGRVQENTVRGTGRRCISLMDGTSMNVVKNELTGVGTVSASLETLTAVDAAPMPTRLSPALRNPAYTAKYTTFQIYLPKRMITWQTVTRRPERLTFLTSTRPTPILTDDNTGESLSSYRRTKASAASVAVLLCGASGEVSGNTVSQADGAAVSVNRAAGAIAVLRNTVLGNTDAGILCAGSTDVQIEDNAFDGCRTPYRLDGSCARCTVNGRLSDGGDVTQAAADRENPGSLRLLAHSGDVSLRCGDYACFGASAAGSGLRWQWYRKPSWSPVWQVWKGQTACVASSMVTSGWDGMQVYCEITDESGQKLRTRPVAVTLTSAVMLIGQSQGSTVADGGSVTLCAAAVGTGLTYQWYFRRAQDDTWKVWRGRTRAVLHETTTYAWQGLQVFCRVSDASGRFCDTDVMKFSVYMPFGAEELPHSVTAAPGEKATFTVRAYGRNLSYRWYCRKPSEVFWQPLKQLGSASVSVTADASMDGMQWYCSVRDGWGHVLYTSPVTLTVTDKTDNQPEADPSSGADIPDICRFPSVRRQVDGFVMLENPRSNVWAQPGQVFTVSVRASGGGLRYQWYRLRRGSDRWCRWEGQTDPSASAVADATWQDSLVFCEVTDSRGVRIGSQYANIVVGSGPQITDQPEDVVLPPDGQAVFRVRAVGCGLWCRWYVRDAGEETWHLWKTQCSSPDADDPLTGNSRAFTLTVPVNAAWDGRQVCCEITDQFRSHVRSRTAAVSVGALAP